HQRADQQQSDGAHGHRDGDRGRDGEGQVEGPDRQAGHPRVLLVVAHREEPGPAEHGYTEYGRPENGHDHQVTGRSGEQRTEQIGHQAAAALAAGQVDQDDTAGDAAVEEHGQRDVAGRGAALADEFDHDRPDRGHQYGHEDGG